jgi:hypothetical protein
VETETKPKVPVETGAKPKVSNKKLGIGCLTVIIIVAVIIGVCAALGGSKDLNASVRFDGDYFIVTNNDSRAWTGVELKLNGGTFTANGGTISAGQEAYYPYGAFSKGDGTRFNPYLQNPKDICINADQGSCCKAW